MSDTWPLGGYAPGNYSCQCHDCNEHFEGDKRAFQCLPCAAKQARGSYASSQAEIERLTEVLYRAQEALGEYACHIGDKHPCIRTADQCRNECGKIAGDAALLIDAALSGSKE